MLRRLPWERLLEIGLLTTAMLLFMTAVAPADRPATDLRVRLQQAVLIDRLVGIGFERVAARQAVEALPAERLAELAGTVGTSRPAPLIMSITAVLSFLTVFLLIVVIRQ